MNANSHGTFEAPIDAMTNGVRRAEPAPQPSGWRALAALAADAVTVRAILAVVAALGTGYLVARLARDGVARIPHPTA